MSNDVNSKVLSIPAAEISTIQLQQNDTIESLLSNVDRETFCNPHPTSYVNHPIYSHGLMPLYPVKANARPLSVRVNPQTIAKEQELVQKKIFDLMWESDQSDEMVEEDDDESNGL